MAWIRRLYHGSTKIYDRAYNIPLVATRVLSDIHRKKNNQLEQISVRRKSSQIQKEKVINKEGSYRKEIYTWKTGEGGRNGEILIF